MIADAGVCGGSFFRHHRSFQEYPCGHRFGGAASEEKNPYEFK